MSKIVMTEMKLIAAACNLMDIIEDSSIDQETIRDSLCDSFFGCDFKTAREKHLVGATQATETPIFVLATVGSNTILARNGVYVSATNPGTDMEIPYHVLYAQALAMTNGEGGVLREFEAPDVLAQVQFDSDDELVQVLDQMQLFSRDPSIFYALHDVLAVGNTKSSGSNGITIDGDLAEQVEYFSSEMKIMPDFLADEIVFLAITRTKKGVIVETGLTFENLCFARYKQDQTWEVPLPTHDDTVMVKIKPWEAQ